MFGLLALAISLTASFVGYSTARRFVRERLRYVDAALSPVAAIIAGIGAAVVAGLVVTPIGWIPLLGKLVGGGTALVFGIGTGLGARAGQVDVKQGYRITSGL
ncbi:MAG: hypothetical protein K1X31_08780 [Gemmatimonadaceae bacterium]|nr:hypothetical protein [Gemmatimonadaceae bacterium]